MLCASSPHLDAITLALPGPELLSAGAPQQVLPDLGVGEDLLLVLYCGDERELAPTGYIW
jgi:hypothetical protein